VGFFPPRYMASPPLGIWIKYNIKIGDTFHIRQKKEEHTSEQPGSRHIGHIVASEGTAATIHSGILKYLEEERIQTHQFGNFKKFKLICVLKLIKVIGATIKNIDCKW
jgi:hypothetical protein